MIYQRPPAPRPGPGPMRRVRSVGMNIGPASRERGAPMAMRPLLPVQGKVMRCPARIICVVGGWRSGKTRGCAIKFYANCIANPWTPAYGEDRPFSIVIGLTWKVLVDSAYRELKAIIPPEAIAHERKGESWEIELRNGHVIKFRTTKGLMQGASACGVWLDEAHLLADASEFENYQTRASDALGARFLVLVSGLPEAGWLQDTFDRPHQRSDPDRAVFFCSTYENKYTPAHVIPQLKSSVSRKKAISRLEGRWQPRERMIYSDWNPNEYPHGNLSKWPGDPRAPCHLGVDVGEQGAVLWFQEVIRTVKDKHGRVHKVKGLHVVDEMLPDGMSVLEVMRLARERKSCGGTPWIISPEHSTIYVDPTTRPDEINNIQAVFPGVNVHQNVRGEPQENVEYGHDAVNAALCDADGVIRVTCYSDLPREDRSLLSVVTRYHRNKQGKPVRDDKVDHVLDAWRYPIVNILPLAATGIVVLDAA